MASRPSQYLFVLAHGELSIAEVITHLDARGIPHRLIEWSEEAAVMELRGASPRQLSRSLGGVHKAGEVVCYARRGSIGSLDDLKRLLDSHRFYEWLDEKVSWGLSAYCRGTRLDRRVIPYLVEYFKERLKREGVRKAKFIIPDRGEGFELFSDDVLRRGRVLEFLVACIHDDCVFARTSAVADHAGFRHRDLKRPAQRPELSLPPRVARLLVNLTGAVKGEVLLDPFCGVGTILQEALMLGIDVRGLDIDEGCVDATLKNLRWLTDHYHLSFTDLGKVLKGDARRLSVYFARGSIDAIATEPILLPPLERFPRRVEAERMIHRAGETYLRALVEMAQVLKRKGRIAIVVPGVRTREKAIVTLPFQKMAKEANLETCYPRTAGLGEYPFFTSTTKVQRVLRGVYVLRKP